MTILLLLLNWFSEFLDSIWTFIKEDIEHHQALVGLIIAALSGLFWLIKNSGRSGTTDLHPFFSTKEVRKASRYYIETKAHIVNSPGGGVEIKESSPLISYFLNKAFKKQEDDQRFYLVLAESGMGKTTFLINLYLRYTRKKARNKFKIELLTLWHPKSWDKLINYPEAEARDTCLLLDALDEDPKALADIKTRLNEIIDKV